MPNDPIMPDLRADMNAWVRWAFGMPPKPEPALPKIDYQERDYLSRVEPTPSAQEEEAESE